MKVQNDEINRLININLRNKIHQRVVNSTSTIILQLMNGTQIQFYFKAQRPLNRIKDVLRSFFTNN